MNEPATWSEDGAVLTICTDLETDFWRRTHYGFVHDNGHVRCQTVSGDFVATVAFDADYSALYDQAGLMVRVDAEHWLKTGIEFVGGHCWISAVVTLDHSDWTAFRLAEASELVHLQVKRRASAYEILWSLDGEQFQMLRLGHLPDSGSAMVGPMACSPSRAGFEARFHDFRCVRLDPDQPFGQ
ncbi:MAG: DUF1349 domain-containing protein [Thermomicrobiales bacterium]